MNVVKLSIFLILPILSGCLAPFSVNLTPQQEFQQITTQQLHVKIQNLEKFSSPTIFERIANGFSINGKDYYDPDGYMKAVQFNRATGFANYLIHVSDSHYLIKLLQVSSHDRPLITADATFENTMWLIKSTTGDQYVGKTLILGSKGFLLVQDNNTILDYDYKKGVSQIHLQKDYQVNKFQNGDFSDTDTILVKNPIVEIYQNSNILAKFINDVASYIEIKKNYNYSLLNIKTNKLIQIGIANDDSPQRVCSKLIGRWHDRRCMLYSYHFQPISRSVEWFKSSSSGIFVITVEGNSKQIFITNLETYQRNLLDTCTSWHTFKGFQINYDANNKVNILTIQDDGTTRHFTL